MIDHITVHLNINKSADDIAVNEAFRMLCSQLLRESKYTCILSVTKIEPLEIIGDDNIHEFYSLEVA